ncbi:uncharacterized protein LOC116254796 [Nymphaea colorata]|uniref:uncharacterized protein LOC116254796 n=1 Tax=Nymphaea colorata TaxID=210225 RepID=UPI00129DD910|nr:uncharacterized protein LOC116254796 [Nymphaea colorata]
MGNHFSCVCAVDFPVVRLADLAGNVHEFPSARAVAELMIEFPGRVVAPADEVLNSRRVRSLRADEEAKPGKLYVLFPMERVNSRVADHEVAAVAAAVSRRSRAKSSGAKVFPTAVVEAGAPKKVRIEAPETGLAGLRLPNYRRWRPELQSINELKCIR